MWSAWLPVAAYAALIFTLSSIPTLAPPSHAPYADKVSHFIEYSILGGILARAWGRSLPGNRLRSRAVLALTMGVAIAALDEIYQGAAGRDKSLGDWCTDAAAITIAVAVDAWTRRDRPHPHWLWRRPADSEDSHA